MSDNSRAPLNCSSDMLKKLFTYHRTYQAPYRVNNLAEQKV